jgi:hypothetical protein
MRGLPGPVQRRRAAGGAAARVAALVRALGSALVTVLAAVPIAWLWSAPAAGQPAPPTHIYTCIDATGKKLTSDRPIAECNAREQRVLNADGSVRRVVPPAPTADERADLEARERDAAAERATKLDAIKRDRNLLARFPSEAVHRKARAAALDDIGKALRVSETKLALLATERKPLLDEAEFYIGKPLPAKLKTQLDANDASIEAQHLLAQNQQAEGVRINKLYDAELERLRKLWGGAQPGTLGELAGAASSAPAAPSARRK